MWNTAGVSGRKSSAALCSAFDERLAIRIVSGDVISHADIVMQAKVRTLPGSFYFPSFEEGRPRRSNNVTLPPEIGAAGEVRRLLQQLSDLPRCALFNVARHFV